MSFEEARLVLLYVLTHELLLEGLSQATDTSQELTQELYDEVCYAELVANKDRHWAMHMYNFMEDEVATAVNNHWEAFTGG